MIHKLLVANRGEIARRIFRTCAELGIATVAVFSDADVGLAHVVEADEAVRIGRAPPSESYLNAEAILAAARRTGADAIHPGYGFLSEDARFAQAVIDAGLTWVGPSPASMTAMGDKAQARKVADTLGVPTVPGYDGPDDDATLIAEAARIGTPLMVKAAAGGGGRGMRRIDDLAALPAALVSARREAEGAFGSGRLLLERVVARPRHIEVQILGDQHGTVVHLGERECSVQRRHQKILEEAPSPVVDDALRTALGEAAIVLAEHLGYHGAGTVEFLVDPDGSFYFLEVNTRLQVEHPVTEEVTGLDLVAWQIWVAEGATLPDDLVDALDGHAIEARIYAEDPLHDYLPGSGTLVRFEVPDLPGVRVDAGYRSGDTVGIHYDAMIAKVIATGADRRTANRRLRRALHGAWAPGVVTNLPLLREIADDEAWQAGDLDTGFLTRRGLPTPPPLNTERGVLVAAAMCWWQQRGDLDAGWRMWGRLEDVDTWDSLGEEVEVGLTARGELLTLRIGDSPHLVRVHGVDGDVVRLEVDGHLRTARVAGEGLGVDGEPIYVHLGDGEAMVRRLPRLPAPAGLEEEPGSCVAPTPGVVRAVHVAVGEAVAEGDLLVTLEAMKMEHALRAPMSGTVEAVRAEVGDAVDRGTLLVRITEES